MIRGDSIAQRPLINNVKMFVQGNPGLFEKAVLKQDGLDGKYETMTPGLRI